MVQLVQNFFNFSANTFFWLSYIPFYHRLFPVFDTTTNATANATRFDDLGSMLFLTVVADFRQQKIGVILEKPINVLINFLHKIAVL
jgi:hypothetical protein